MDDVVPPAQEAPQWLLDLLEESEAEAEAGQTVPWPEARARLMGLIEEQDRRRAQPKP